MGIGPSTLLLRGYSGDQLTAQTSKIFDCPLKGLSRHLKNSIGAASWYARSYSGMHQDTCGLHILLKAGLPLIPAPLVVEPDDF